MISSYVCVSGTIVHGGRSKRHACLRNRVFLLAVSETLDILGVIWNGHYSSLMYGTMNVLGYV